jgi:oxygen-independent coproporphyrinogen-3 oxidase
MALGLYLHVPFCVARCHFCAFSLEIHREDRVLAYLAALDREIARHAAHGTLAGRVLETIYVGGGTPTTLAPDQLADILERLHERFDVAPDAEITVEAHPDSVTPEGLGRLVAAGFNRISLGVQSMDADALVRVGRRTAPDRTRVAVAAARAAGFANLNLDLIYGLPGQGPADWRATLEAALALQPDHLAAYALTIEERTRLAVDARRGEAVEPDPETQLAMEEETASRLAHAGFERYEISNWCRPGFACRHNLLYWRDGEYLGLGPSAQSYLDGRRFGNLESLADWRRALEAGASPVAESERLDAARRRREALVFGLRLTEGRAASEVPPEAGEAVDRLVAAGLLEERAGRIRLTDRGRRYADSVAVELL